MIVLVFLTCILVSIKSLKFISCRKLFDIYNFVGIGKSKVYQLYQSKLIGLFGQNVTHKPALGFSRIYLYSIVLVFLVYNKSMFGIFIILL